MRPSTRATPTRPAKRTACPNFPTRTPSVAILQRSASSCARPPPPLGEDPQHAAYRQAREYSRIIKDVARQTGIAYLPVNEQMDRILQPYRHASKLPFDQVTDARYLVIKIRRFVLGQSFESISRRYGFKLLTDGIHLNPTGAEIIADAIQAFILTVEKNDSLRLPRYCTLRNQGRLADPRAHAS